MAKRITILGSTGSIGRNALEVIASLGPDYQVAGLAARSRWEELLAQARRFGPRAIAIGDASLADRLACRLNGTIGLLAGPEGLVELVRCSECDFVLSAIVGSAGLPATVAAVEMGKTVGLASKEVLVVAGSLVVPLARRTGAKLLPIDSEHSAIFQAMHAGNPDEVVKVYLTASGGPFRDWPAERIAEATLEDALRHPTWKMGPKITIDSATMMNKALEIIEAKWLFGLEPDAIEVVIHPESIIHSMVEFCDGSVIAQLGMPDMRTPIQYALTFPRRVRGPSRRLDLAALRQMHFEPPDPERFPALKLGYEVARVGGTAGAVLNAANEVAVQAFRDGRIRFGQIIELTGQVLDRHERIDEPDFDDLLAADAWARREVHRCLSC